MSRPPHLAPLKLMEEFFEWTAKRHAIGPGPGTFIRTNIVDLGQALGEPGGQNIVWAAEQLAAHGWIEYGQLTHGGLKLRLTQAGWLEYGHRFRAGEPNRAFMALKFNAPDLTALVEQVCKPSAETIGLSLVTALDVARAGLIDDIMRVEIRRARVVLVELTHSNRGAYWEGGFAEGLGKPTIYLCRRLEWEREKTHFDTEHLHTIVWDPDDLADAHSRLTAALANTLNP